MNHTQNILKTLEQTNAILHWVWAKETKRSPKALFWETRQQKIRRQLLGILGNGRVFWWEDCYPIGKRNPLYQRRNRGKNISFKAKSLQKVHIKGVWSPRVLEPTSGYGILQISFAQLGSDCFMVRFSSRFACGSKPKGSSLGIVATLLSCLFQRVLTHDPLGLWHQEAQGPAGSLGVWLAGEPGLVGFCLGQSESPDKTAV